MSKPRNYNAESSTGSGSVDHAGDFLSSWKQAPNGWGHSLHALAPYVGSFPPELAHFFIRKFSDIGDTVLDPFCGRGTVPLEAGIHNRKAIASDKFSYAYTLTKAKCNPVPDSHFREYLDDILEEAASISSGKSELLDNEDLETFFSEYTLKKILRLREVLSRDTSTEATYLNAMVCGILHGPDDRFLSLQTKDTYSGTPNYVEEYADKHDLELPERDLRPRILQNHNLAQEDYIPPWLGSQTSIRQSGARDLPFESNQADLVVTSPPYLRKLDYTWNNWIRLWWLQQNRKLEQQELDMTSNLTLYREFMRKSLKEMSRVLREDSVAVFIVGDVIKRLTNKNQVVNIASLIREEAAEYTDFEYKNTIVDDYDIGNRSYVSANQTKYEYTDDKRDDFATVDRCLILTKGSPDVNQTPRINWEVELYKDKHI